jgi:glycosyltransferase involved in cell wall biosynthesis
MQEIYSSIEKHFSRTIRRSNPNFNRSFVRYKDPKPSPGQIWHYVSDNHQNELTVVIPTLDGCRGGYLLRLIKQILSQNYRSYEIFIVQGDPSQGRAINLAVSFARGKYILTLDDDTSLPDSNIFSKLVKVVEKYSDIGMAGGINIIPNNAKPFIMRTMKELPRRSTPKVDRIVDSDMAEHPLLIMRKRIFIEIGGENELIPRGLDPYLREKFRKAGFRVVVVPAVEYSHLPPATLPKLIKQFYKNGKKAAFCNIFFPQWVIETPNFHGEFNRKMPFPRRVIRYAKQLLNAAFESKWILFISQMAYASGFLLEALYCMTHNKKRFS